MFASCNKTIRDVDGINERFGPSHSFTKPDFKKKVRFVYIAQSKERKKKKKSAIEKYLETN